MVVEACAGCSSLTSELVKLRIKYKKLQSKLHLLEKTPMALSNDQKDVNQGTPVPTSPYSAFSRVELQRYGRQMLVKEFGVKAQLKLRAARVLLIGVGGLGSPVAMYLAAMGVGTLAIVDNDHVDRSNLHRQILHDEKGARDCEKKVVSAKRRLLELNPLLQCIAYPTRFTTTNALNLVKEYDIVVDASDNAGTRYLVNDACAQLQKPLISGSALGFEGQVTVFTYRDDANATGCYRCLYPKPPLLSRSCAENGVIGVVPGVIGCLQAIETVKVITGVGEPLVGLQCFYDAFDGKFRHLKMKKKRNPQCLSCSRHSILLKNGSEMAPVDSSRFVQDVVCDDKSACLDLKFQVSAEEFANIRTAAFAQDIKQNERGSRYVLLDTRSPCQFEMVHFPEAVNIPTNKLMKTDPMEVLATLHGVPTSEFIKQLSLTAKRTYVICRRGVDSIKVTQWLLDRGIPNVFNITGGYTEYSKEGGVDPTFPMY